MTAVAPRPVVSRAYPVDKLRPGVALLGYLKTTDPKTLDLDDTIRDAIVLMQTGRYRNVPMVDADRQLVGVVRQSDIIKYLAESFPEELLNLPPRPHQTMKRAEGG